MMTFFRPFLVRQQKVIAAIIVQVVVATISSSPSRLRCMRYMWGERAPSIFNRKRYALTAGVLVNQGGKPVLSVQGRARSHTINVFRLKFRLGWIMVPRFV